MQSTEKTHAEQLAERLIAGEEDPLVFQSLRYAALAQANDWQAVWLASELVAVFDGASAAGRSHAETAAIVLGLLRATRLGFSELKKRAEEKASRLNATVMAAGITALGLISAAGINYLGNVSAAKARPSPTPVPVAETKPNVIQIVVPTQPPADGAQAAALASPAPSPAEPAPDPMGSAKPSPKPTPSALPSALAAPADPEAAEGRETP